MVHPTLEITGMWLSAMDTNDSHTQEQIWTSKLIKIQKSGSNFNFLYIFIIKFVLIVIKSINFVSCYKGLSVNYMNLFCASQKNHYNFPVCQSMTTKVFIIKFQLYGGRSKKL